MPYNTTAIPPRKEVTGQPVLPLARVKKIIHQDQDVEVCSNNAAFIITLATEMFIQHLSGEAQNMAKLDRKPRRNVQYKDVANAVAHHDHLEFLEDVVPKTVPYKKIKGQAAAARAQAQGDQAQDGQKQANFGEASRAKAPHANGSGSSNSKRKSSSGVNGARVNGTTSATAAAARDDDGSRSVDPSGDDPSAQLEAEMRQAAEGPDQDGDLRMSG